VNNQCGPVSLTHPWSAGVTKWLSEEVLDIKPASPGFKTFIVKPYLSAAITWVKGTVPTTHGIISFTFDAITGKGELTVPHGTQATLCIPKARRKIVHVEFDDNHFLKNREDAQYIYYTGLTDQSSKGC